MTDTCQNDWHLSKPRPVPTSPQLFLTVHVSSQSALTRQNSLDTEYLEHCTVSYLWCFLELNGEKEVLLRRVEVLLDGLLSSVASSTFNCGMIWPPTVQDIFLDCSCKAHLTSREMESSPLDEMRTGGACLQIWTAGVGKLANWFEWFVISRSETLCNPAKSARLN